MANGGDIVHSEAMDFVREIIPTRLSLPLPLDRRRRQPACRPAGCYRHRYIPAEDAVRLWGYVDDIYIPLGKTAYSPLVISTEHGLFCWGGYGRVWHHYLPHYWGANSAWLDTRELVPHRRPTCIAADGDGNLWIGTEWDGLVRLNAQARKYHNREPEKNKKDGTEFGFSGPKEIGCKFDRVADLAAADKGVWAVLTSREHGSALARFDGQDWVTHPLDGPARCVAEVEPGVVLIGVDGAEWGRYHGLRKVTWASKKIERPVGPEGAIHKIVRLTNGRVVAASWWSLFESDSTVKKAREPMTTEQRRKNPAPEQVVRRLAAKCEPPTWTEGHGLTLVDGQAK